jgi:hypothetical protein
MSSQPQWMSEDTQQQNFNNAPMAGYKPPGPGVSNPNSEQNTYLRVGVKLIIIASAVMMVAHGILSLLNISDAKNAVADGFVALYVLLFASLLLFHEISQFYPIEQIDVIVRRNFGFLYKPLGKGIFMIFIAFLNFGISVDTTLGMITGIVLAIVGVVYVFLYLQNPDAFVLEGPSQPSQPLPQYAPHSDQGF